MTTWLGITRPFSHGSKVQAYLPTIFLEEDGFWYIQITQIGPQLASNNHQRTKILKQLLPNVNLISNLERFSASKTTIRERTTNHNQWSTIPLEFLTVLVQFDNSNVCLLVGWCGHFFPGGLGRHPTNPWRTSWEYHENTKWNIEKQTRPSTILLAKHYCTLTLTVFSTVYKSCSINQFNLVTTQSVFLWQSFQYCFFQQFSELKK